MSELSKGIERVRAHFNPSEKQLVTKIEANGGSIH